MMPENHLELLGPMRFFFFLQWCHGYLTLFWVSLKEPDWFMVRGQNNPKAILELLA